VVARAVCRDWRRHLVLVRPESVIRWHRQAWRLAWRWRSRGLLGRPRLSAEVCELIATMARDNPRWGSERIRGELLKLGLVISQRSIQRYRRRGPASPSSQRWRTFLANHAHHLWATDLLTVQTLTFKTLYVLVFIGTLRRECLDHLIVLDEQHLRSVLAESVRYYNLDRPHRTLCLETPVPTRRAAKGPVRSRPVLGGLHHVYERAA